MSMPAWSLCPYNCAVTTIYPGRLSVGLLQTTASKHLQDKTEAKEWDFLQNDINTQKLFQFLSQNIMSANYLMAKIHVIESLMVGCSTYLIQTVDTDIVVILVGKFYYLLTLNTSVNIWVAFKTGKNYKYLSINFTLYGALVNKWTEQAISRIFRMEAWWEHMHVAHGYLSELHTVETEVFIAHHIRCADGVAICTPFL